MPPVEKLEQPTKGQQSQDIHRKIGLQLRAMYTNVVNEGVPDRFAELIRRLDKQDLDKQDLNKQGLNKQDLNKQDLE
jgi:Anti-sigma factor NepR